MPVLQCAGRALGRLIENIPACSLWPAGRKPLVQANLLLQMLPCSRGCRFSDQGPEPGCFAPVFRCRCLHGVSSPRYLRATLRSSRSGSVWRSSQWCRFFVPPAPSTAVRQQRCLASDVPCGRVRPRRASCAKLEGALRDTGLSRRATSSGGTIYPIQHPTNDTVLQTRFADSAR